MNLKPIAGSITALGILWFVAHVIKLCVSAVAVSSSGSWAFAAVVIGFSALFPVYYIMKESFN